MVVVACHHATGHADGEWTLQAHLLEHRVGAVTLLPSLYFCS